MTRYGKTMSQALAEMQMNELKMNDPKLNKIFDKLKPRDTIQLKVSSSIAKGKDFQPYTVKSKNTLRNGTEKISMILQGNPTGVKRFLYRKDGKVTFAIGDMAASIDDIKEDITEGTWKMPDNPKEVAALKKLMSRPLPIGNTEDEKMYKDSANAKLYGLLGDDELFDALGALEDKGKEKADARKTIIKWFQQRVKDDSYGLGDETKKLGKAIGLKMEYIPEGLDEKKTVPSILMPMSVEREIEKMVKDRKYKGNTSALMKDVKKKYSKYYDNVDVQGLLQKHAETNESNRIDNFDENYRKLAMKGIGTETKKAAKVGLKTDYYLPKNGDKSFGKITRVTSSGYEITDEKTKKVYKFKFYDPNNDPTSVRGTREEVELDEMDMKYVLINMQGKVQGYSSDKRDALDIARRTKSTMHPIKKKISDKTLEKMNALAKTPKELKDLGIIEKIDPADVDLSLIHI